MTTQDQKFTLLATLPDHLGSFTANLETGELIESTENITQRHATAAHKLLQNVSLLLEKQRNNINKNSTTTNGLSGGGSAISGVEDGSDEKQEEGFGLEKVTVTYGNYGYGFALSDDDKFYAISQSINND